MVFMIIAKQWILPLYTFLAMCKLDSPRMIVAIIKFDPEVAEQSISVSLWKWATTDDPHHVIRKANLPYKLDE